MVEKMKMFETLVLPWCVTGSGLFGYSLDFLTTPLFIGCLGLAVGLFSYVAIVNILKYFESHGEANG